MNKQTLLTLAALLLASPALASGPKPAITLSSSALSFNGSSGQVSSQPLTITSQSTAALTISALLPSNAAFAKSATTLPVTLSKGQSVTVHITAQPVASAVQGLLTICTTGGLLSIPISETATQAAAHQVALQWDASASGSDVVSNYEVNRAPSGSTQFATLGKTAASTTAWTDASVQAGSTYVYEVLAIDKSGKVSSPSNKLTVTIP